MFWMYNIYYYIKNNLYDILTIPVIIEVFSRRLLFPVSLVYVLYYMVTCVGTYMCCCLHDFH